MGGVAQLPLGGSVCALLGVSVSGWGGGGNLSYGCEEVAACNPSARSVSNLQNGKMPIG